MHEIGHALKLAHPKDGNNLINNTYGRNNYSNDNCIISIMNQGDPSLYEVGIPFNLACMEIKNHDIINLRNKWN